MIVNAFLSDAVKKGFLRAHLFLVVIFFSVILIEVIIPMKNVGVLFDINFYRSILNSPLFWIVYFFSLMIFIGRPIFGFLTKGRKG